MLPSREILLSLCLCAMIFIYSMYATDALGVIEKNRFNANYAASSWNEEVYSEATLHFPADEGSHGTTQEWWYVTSRITTQSGINYTCTVAYVKPSNLKDTPYCNRLISIVDETNGAHFGQFLRGSFTSQIGFLSLTYANQDGDFDYWFQKESELFNYSLFTVAKGIFSLDVSLSANKAPLLHGGDGVIPMGYGGDSYYYSQTSLSLNGTLNDMAHGTIEEVSGVAWIDHQWGDWSDSGYDGWEWFAIRLSDGSDVMVFCFFDPVTGERMDKSVSASVLFSDGSSYYLGGGEVGLVNLAYFEKGATGMTYSSGWRLVIERFGLDLSIVPVVRDQTAGILWEGSCYVSGVFDGRAVDGICTAELTHNYHAPMPSPAPSPIPIPYSIPTITPSPTLTPRPTSTASPGPSSGLAPSLSPTPSPTSKRTPEPPPISEQTQFLYLAAAGLIPPLIVIVAIIFKRKH
jgi:predicted secreted hydrolase